MITTVLAKVNIQLALAGMSVPVIKILKYFCPHWLTVVFKIPMPFFVRNFINITMHGSR